MSNREVVYTDGACVNNGKNGASAGYGVYYGDNDSRNISQPLNSGRQTNQRAELKAAIDGVRYASRDSHVEIKTDSNYVVQGMNSWSKNWERNGYKNYYGEPVANADLFKELRDVSRAHGSVEFSHVRGHQGNYGNDRADELAKAGASKNSHYKSYYY